MRLLWICVGVFVGCGSEHPATDSSPSCGDGSVDPGEACDLGPANSDRGECTSTCEVARCGDGWVGPDDACDDGNDVDDDACTNACEPARCGDGFLGPAEACDDGNDVDDDVCSNRCGLPTCGDGILQDGEECDDKDDDDADECLSSCIAARCGDAVVRDGFEECDDANAEDLDGCLGDCTAARMVLGTCESEAGPFVPIEDGDALPLFPGPGGQAGHHILTCLRERGLVRDPPLKFSYSVVDQNGLDSDNAGPGEYLRPDGDSGWQPEAEAWFEVVNLRTILAVEYPEDVEGRTFDVTAILTEDDEDVFQDTRRVTVYFVY